MTYSFTHRTGLAALALAVFTAISPVAAAQDAAACKTVNMSDPGWIDITATDAVAGVLLDALGYVQNVRMLSVIIGYETLKNRNTDVFLGNWMPAQQNFIEDLNRTNAIEVLATNLVGTKFTLAVPDYVANAGIRDFKDVAANADKFGKKIYGIEPGAPANITIEKMIAGPSPELKGWTLIESSEQGMLAQVSRAERSKQWIVFLAWSPHPMNEKFAITYLSGGDAYFGPNYGGGSVRTVARSGWSAQCPNAARLFRNLKFDLPMENALISAIMDEHSNPKAAARSWLNTHPDALAPWLEGVTTLDGKPGLAAVRTAIGL
ncbi:choline ABC transporter substrate-binding protein [Acetobacter sp. TBRC 12305]|uniref:Choline ABC transporter substrate-binding protein n=1 Tax=Acetobacter garciniae TaxID=2817435 RepID=A0A939KLQ5_9PROT|nr:choline ABC transporter substrate-binding protein [Acetobacter garciniae]MBO1324488.1 choline ABC transporter substrate-binding protein [Acetobacter garciniae]MBX0344177.1 choline ABC transporter substrate-binding protein [Acetobacter garciniae]